MPKNLHLIVGDGVVGQTVAADLVRRGLPHALASRSLQGTLPADTPRRRLDALDRASLMQATAGASHVYVTLGLAYDTRVWQRDWPPIVENVIAAARQHGFKLMFFDNVYPYGPAPLQVPMREDHPQHPPSAKGRVRKALDDRLLRAVAEDGLRLVIARAADFYGPGVRNSMLYQAAIERQLAGKAAQWIGNPDLRHSYTYTEDAAKALVELALDDGADGQVWHLPTAEPAPTTRHLLELSARHLRAPTRIAVLPRPVLAVLKWFLPVLREVDEMLYQSRHDYVFSSEKFRQRYPAFAVTPYEQGIVAMLDSLREGKPSTVRIEGPASAA